MLTRHLTVRSLCLIRPAICSPCRPLSITAAVAGKQFPPRLVISDNDIEESFLRGSGPGGQKINKTASAVQLKHIPTGLVVKSQATRSRSQNRQIARRILAERLEELEKGEESRTAVKREIAAKKKASKAKKSKRKYRRLEEERQTQMDADQRNGASDGEADHENAVNSNGNGEEK